MDGAMGIVLLQQDHRQGQRLGYVCLACAHLAVVPGSCVMGRWRITAWIDMSLPFVEGHKRMDRKM